MDELTNAFEISLLDPTLYEACGDFAESTIDAIISSDIAKNVPIVSVLVGTVKTLKNVHDRHLLKQTLTFIKTFNDGSISVDKKIKYKNKIENDPKKAEEELGRVLLLLGKTIDADKAKILANLFKSYLSEGISWDDFCEMSEAVDRIYLQDISLLLKVYHREVNSTTQCRYYQSERLIAIGFISSATQNIMISSNANQSKTDKYIMISEFGERFCKYGLS